MCPPLPEAGAAEGPRRIRAAVTHAFVVEDGRVAIPDGPGWGVEIRDDWLRRAEHRIAGRR